MSIKTVDIIIISAGREDFLRGLMESVKRQDHPLCQIIVIDNLADKLSYCRALNKGIAKSSAEFVLCLNDDVILENDFIKQSLQGFAVDERIGMVSGKILRWDKKTIDSTGLFLSIFRTARERGYGLLNRGQFERAGRIFGVNGAVAFYRRKMLDELAVDGEIFDEDMGFFYEDLDIAWRARNSGWGGFYESKAVAYHLRGGTARPSAGFNKKFSRRYLSDELHFELIKNRYLTIIKNDKPVDFMICFGFILFYDLLSWFYLILFRPEVLRLFFLKRIPVIAVFKKRKTPKP